MKLRTIMLLLSGLMLSQCQTTTNMPPVLPPQEMPAEPLAAGEIKKVLMTTADHEYLTALLKPMMESETIEFTDESGGYSAPAPARDIYIPAPSISGVSPMHFRVLAACPHKIYTGELTDTFTDYRFTARDEDGAYSLTVSMSRKPEHGVRIGGIAISSPTFHHFIQTLIQKSKAEQAPAETAEIQP